MNKKVLYDCGKVIYVRLRKDLGFAETGNYGFCTINKNSMKALQPCCEDLCPLGLKVSGGETMEKLLGYYPLASKILVVAIKGEVNDWAAYIESVAGINHDNEAKEIMRERKGTKIPYEVAKILFPHIASEYVWRN